MVKSDYQNGQIGLQAGTGFPVRVRAYSRSENPDLIHNNISNHNLRANTKRKLNNMVEKIWDTYLGTYPGNGVLHTANIVGSSTTPNRTKGKQQIVSSYEFDTEPEGVYWHTRTRTGTIAPVDYSALDRGIEISEVHSAIAESQASKLFRRERSLRAHGRLS